MERIRELIDKAALIAEYDRVHVGPPGGARKLMEDAPIIEERKTGRWKMEPDPYGFFEEIPVCSECGCTTEMRKTYKFCPNCGADMRGEQDDKEKT